GSRRARHKGALSRTATHFRRRGSSMKLVGNLHAYVWEGNDNNCNSYALAGVMPGGKHLLVDPGHIHTPYFREPALDRLKSSMAADGVDPGAVGLVVLTHFHPDHCEAAGVFRKESGARVAIHQDEEAFYRGFGGELDQVLKEGELELGGEERGALPLQIIHSPGHSPGHITIYCPEQKALIAGDVIFYRSTGRVDLPGGSGRALKASIEKLAELQIDYLLCGHAYGHSGVIEGEQEVRENFEFLRRHVLS
ncbi:MAG: MBL fold metallo-hydrolase, partial [bacterium]